MHSVGLLLAVGLMLIIQVLVRVSSHHRAPARPGLCHRNVVGGVDAETHQEAEDSHGKVPQACKEEEAEPTLRDGKRADEDVEEGTAPELCQEARTGEDLDLVTF